MYFSRQLGNGTTFRKSIKYSILTVFPFLDHSAILHITCEPRQQAKILECIAIITLSNVFSSATRCCCFSNSHLTGLY